MHARTRARTRTHACTHTRAHVDSCCCSFLQQYSKSYEVDGVRRSDPFMTIVPPVEQFTNNYTFSTLTTRLLHVNDDFDHYVNVVILTDLIDGIRLDDLPLEPDLMFRNWTYLPHSNYSHATILIPVGVHHIRHVTGSANFSATLYGLKFQEAYAHPLGQNVEVIPYACTHTFMLSDDGFDNDCDQRTDEELLNGIDDDGDGLIDEDIATVLRWSTIEADGTTRVGDGWVRPTPPGGAGGGIPGGADGKAFETSTGVDGDVAGDGGFWQNGTWIGTNSTSGFWSNGTWVPVSGDGSDAGGGDGGQTGYPGSNTGSDTSTGEENGSPGFWWDDQWISLENYTNSNSSGFWLNGTWVDLNAANGTGFFFHGNWIPITRISGSVPGSEKGSGISNDETNGFTWNGKWIDLNNSSIANSTGFWLNGTWMALNIVNATGFFFEGKWVPITRSTGSDPDSENGSGISNDETNGFTWNGKWIDLNNSSIANSTGFWLNGTWMELNTINATGFFFDGEWVPITRSAGSDPGSGDGSGISNDETNGFTWNGKWIDLNNSSIANSTGFWLNGTWMELNTINATGFYFHGEWVPITRSTGSVPDSGNGSGISNDETNGFTWNGKWIDLNNSSIANSTGFWLNGTWMELNTINATGFYFHGEWVPITRSTGSVPDSENGSGISNGETNGFTWNGKWIDLNNSSIANSTGFWLNGTWMELNTINATGFYFDGKWVPIVKSTGSDPDSENGSGISNDEANGFTWNGKWIDLNNSSIANSTGFWLNGTWMELNTINATGFYFDGEWVPIVTSTGSDPDSENGSGISNDETNGFTWNGKWIDLNNSSIANSTGFWLNGTWMELNTINATGFYFHGEWVPITRSTGSVPESENGSGISNDETNGFTWNGKWIDLNNSSIANSTGFWLNGTWMELNTINATGFYFHGEWVPITRSTGSVPESENGSGISNDETNGFTWNGKWIDLNNSSIANSTGFWLNGTWMELNTINATGFYFHGEWVPITRSTGSVPDSENGSGISNDETNGFTWNGKWIDLNNSSIANSTGFWLNGTWMELNTINATGFYFHGEWVPITRSTGSVPDRENGSGISNDETNGFVWNGKWIDLNNSSIANSTGFWLNGTWVELNTMNATGFFFEGEWVPITRSTGSVPESENGSGISNDETNGFTRNGKWIDLNNSSIANSTGFWLNGTWMELNTINATGFYFHGKWVPIDRSTDSDPDSENGSGISNGETNGFTWNGKWIDLNNSSIANSTGFWLNGTWMELNTINATGFYFHGEWVPINRSTGHVPDSENESGINNDETNGFTWNGKWIDLNNASIANSTGFWLNGTWVELNTINATGFCFQGEWVPINRSFVSVSESGGGFGADEDKKNGFSWNGKWIDLNNSSVANSTGFWLNGMWVNANATTNGTMYWYQGKWVSWDELSGSKPGSAAQSGNDSFSNLDKGLNGNWTNLNNSIASNTTGFSSNGDLFDHGAINKTGPWINETGFWWNDRWVDRGESGGSNSTGFWWNDEWVQWAEAFRNSSSRNATGSWVNGQWIPSDRQAGQNDRTVKDDKTPTTTTDSSLASSGTSPGSTTTKTDSSDGKSDAPVTPAAVTSRSSFNYLYLLIPAAILVAIPLVCLLYCGCVRCHRWRRRRGKVGPAVVRVRPSCKKYVVESPRSLAGTESIVVSDASLATSSDADTYYDGKARLEGGRVSATTRSYRDMTIDFYEDDQVGSYEGKPRNFHERRRAAGPAGDGFDDIMRPPPGHWKERFPEPNNAVPARGLSSLQHFVTRVSLPSSNALTIIEYK